MADDTIVYDYATIDQCLSMMSKKAEEIQNQTDALETDVKNIMADWKGSTAEAYDQLCSDLRNDLISNRNNLDNLNKAFDEAAENMKQQDKSGAGNVGSS
jgi:WXG100 family type VII secretion target